MISSRSCSPCLPIPSLVLLSWFLCFCGCQPASDSPSRLGKDAKQPARRSVPSPGNSDQAKEARRFGEQLFAKLGLSRTNFNFEPEVIPEGQERADSRKEAVVHSAEQDKVIRAQRLDWNHKTLGEVYRMEGRRDSRWDAPAEKSLELFAQMRVGSGRSTHPKLDLDDQLAKAVKEATDAIMP